MPHYLALLSDYDGTLAQDSTVSPETIAAIERLLESGRHFVLVTGRRLDDLMAVFPRLDLCAQVVVENGAVLYTPATGERKRFGSRPPPRFIEALAARGVAPLDVGEVILATWEPHSTAVFDVIKSLGLELQVILNKGAVMVLPPGINKASGITAALDALGLSAQNAVGIGDAENDHAFLRRCEVSIAVANALPAVMESADFVTARDHGAGVTELVDMLIADDLAARDSQLPSTHRRNIPLGHDAAGSNVAWPLTRMNTILVGASGGGKTRLASGLLERTAAAGYGFCVLDPEGDYEALDGAVTIGTAREPPSLDDVMQLLDTTGNNVTVNLVGVPIEDRPSYFLALLPRMLALRTRTGRPHWLLIDEAHHLMPRDWQSVSELWPRRFDGLARITVHPDHLCAATLAGVDAVIAVGAEANVELSKAGAALGKSSPPLAAAAFGDKDTIVAWRVDDATPKVLTPIATHSERQRHRRKYAEGELGVDRSFYFRGANGQLNLRAPNLLAFTELAAGVDAETWQFHLERGDYSRWIAESIKDPDLAEQIQSIERGAVRAPEATLAAVRQAIAERYTRPA